MPRKPRPSYPDTYYHVIARGNARQDVFLTDGDRKRFLSLLKKYSTLLEVRALVWCLMTNHVHLLLHTKHANLSVFMQRLLTAYSMAFNLKNHRVGHLFQGRFKSLVVDADEYLVELSRYIHLNPVRAGLVAAPDEWRWSSLLAHAGFAPREDPTDTGEILSRFGGKREEYLDFVLAGIGKEFKFTIWEGIYLGGKRFAEKWERRLRGKAKPAEALPRGPKWDDVVAAVGKTFGRSPGYEVSRTHANSEARRALAYLGRERLGLSLIEIGGKLGVSPSGVHLQAKLFGEKLRRSLSLPQKLKKIKV